MTENKLRLSGPVLSRNVFGYILALLGLLAIWAWTIPSALHEHRSRSLLASEGVLADGEILWQHDLWISPEAGYFIGYRFADVSGRLWRGQGRGFPSLDVRTGQKGLLVTYATSDPAVNKLGNHTHESMRRRLATSATTFPLFLLLVQGVGLSLLLLSLLRRCGWRKQN